MQVFFEKRKNKKERETTKENYSLQRTNRQETVSFEKKETAQKEQFKKHIAFFVKKGEYVKGEIFKRREKRCSDQTEFSEKKRDTEKGTNSEQHSKKRTKKKKN